MKPHRAEGHTEVKKANEAAQSGRKPMKPHTKWKEAHEVTQSELMKPQRAEESQQSSTKRKEATEVTQKEANEVI